MLLLALGCIKEAMFFVLTSLSMFLCQDSDHKGSVRQGLMCIQIVQNLSSTLVFPADFVYNQAMFLDFSASLNSMDCDWSVLANQLNTLVYLNAMCRVFLQFCLTLIKRN